MSTLKLNIKKTYLNMILSGKKTVEVRIGYSKIKSAKKGDTIIFKEAPDKEFIITRVTKYSSFKQMVNNEDVSNIIPYKSTEEVLKLFNKIYPGNNQKLGVYAMEIKPVKNKEIKYSNIRSFLDKREEFSILLSKLYNVTDFVVEDYPKHFEWFYKKAVPDIFEGKRDIFFAIFKNKVIGINIAKKDEEESKICTLWVDPNYRGLHIATKLIENSFVYLNTTKPVISIAEFKKEQFEGLIKKYNWELVQTLDGYYNSSKELVYNGKLE